MTAAEPHAHRDPILDPPRKKKKGLSTGAIIGMLAGATYGVDDIPARWLRKLDGEVRAEIERQTDGLLALAPAFRTP